MKLERNRGTKTGKRGVIFLDKRGEKKNIKKSKSLNKRKKIEPHQLKSTKRIRGKKKTKRKKGGAGGGARNSSYHTVPRGP